jgi:hypothetical protein
MGGGVTFRVTLALYSNGGKFNFLPASARPPCPTNARTERAQAEAPRSVAA